MSCWKDIGVVGYAMNVTNCGLALGELGWAKPTLYVSSHFVGDGHQVAERLGMNLAVFEPEDCCSWYIEWNGQRVGSVGA